MKRITFLSAGTAALLVAAGLYSEPAYALLNHTFVKTGAPTDGSVPCSREQPCGSLQSAHDNTISGGVIAVIDHGDYNQVAITKSVSIVAIGIFAGTVSGTPAITVTAPGAFVTMKGL